MGNSSTIPDSPLPFSANRRFSDKSTPKNDNFEQRWQCFIDSLDVPEGKLRLIEQMPYQRKLELLLNYELRTVTFSPVNCVEGIRTAKLSHIAISKRKQDHEDFRKIFTSAEISLRTNKIEWVLEFLDNQGLEAIITFMGDSLKFLSKSDIFRSTLCDPTHRKPSLIAEEFGTASLANRGSKNSSSPSKLKSAREINEKDKLTTPYTPNFSLSRTKSSSPTLRHQNVPVYTSLTLETLKDCLHLCLKCFKTMLNNQSGCTKAFENPEVIEIITFCLLHPSYSTKALALDLLSAVCLIEGGHARVLKAFDYFRRTIGENASFETLMNDFRIHEDLPLDQYILEYSVACIQFINIVVHSPENINLRVYLQYGFHLLGLEEFLRTLQARPGDKLNRHVDAYMNNMVNCSLLLDDAEAKEAAVEEAARLEAALEASETSARQAAASFKQRDLALSELVESLRGKIRDINVATGIQETSAKRIQELDFSLAAAHRQIQRLQDAMAMAQTEALTTGKRSVCNMTTSTTLPLGFGGQDASSRTDESRKQSGVKGGVVGDRKSMRSASLNFSAAVRSSTSSVTSSASPSSPASSSIDDGETPIQFGTFSRQSVSVGEKPRHGIISCTLISLVGDLGSARKLFANVSSSLSLLANKLSKSLRLPTPSPALPQPDWHSLSFACSTTTTSCSLYRADAPNSVAQLTMVLPEPWASCLASADRQFKLSSTLYSAPVAEDMEERILSWLVTTSMVTQAALDTISNEHCSSEDLTGETLPLITSLLGVNLNPFTATRLFSVLAAVVDLDNGKDRRLITCFDAFERLLRESTVAREVADMGRVVNETASWSWPLLQAYLRVNLLPFIFSRSMEVLIEQLSILSNCCNSIVTSDKLHTVLKTTESLIAALLAKPDFPTLELTNLSTLVDWSMLMRRSNSKVESGTDSPRQPRRSSDSFSASPLLGSTHRVKPFLEALYKAIELNNPDTLDWTADIVHLETASRILPSDIRDRIRELEYDLSLRDALFPAPQLPGFLQYLPVSAWSCLGELKGILTEVETLVGAAAFKLYSATGSKGIVASSACSLQEKQDTFSDRDFSAELVSLSRFSTAFKKLTGDCEKRRRGQIKASSCKVSSHRRNGHQRNSESKNSTNNHHQDKHDGDRKRHGARHMNTVGIMDNILAGLEPEPLYADIHKPQIKPSTHSND